MSLFQKATKRTARLRMALIGPSGSGKTYSSLVLATHLAARPDGSPGRIAVIDTEHGSASKYSDEYAFDVLELASFDPRNYIDAIQAAEQERYDVLIIDSLTHAWSGKGGALELVDTAAKKSRSNNSFTAWRDVTPLHNALVDAMIGSGCHIIATMRSKSEYALEADPHTGKLTPRKLGLAPIQREGMDYEFDVVGDIDLDHVLIIGKTRCKKLDRATFNPPGRTLAFALKEWLSDGAPALPAAVPAAQQAAGANGATSSANLGSMLGLITQEQIAELRRLIDEAGMTDAQVRTALSRRGVADILRLTSSDATAMIGNLLAVIDRKKWESDNFMTQKEWEDHQAKQTEQPATETSETIETTEATEVQTADAPPSEDATTSELAASDPVADDHVIPPVTRRERPERPRKSKKTDHQPEAISNA